MVGFFVEALHSCTVFDERHDDLSIVSYLLLLDDHVIAIVDAGFDHGIPMHGKDE